MNLRKAVRLSGVALATAVSGAILVKPAAAQKDGIERYLSGIKVNASAKTVLSLFGNPNDIQIGDTPVRPPSNAGGGGQQGGFGAGGMMGAPGDDAGKAGPGMMGSRGGPMSGGMMGGSGPMGGGMMGGSGPMSGGMMGSSGMMGGSGPMGGGMMGSSGMMGGSGPMGGGMMGSSGMMGGSGPRGGGMMGSSGMMGGSGPMGGGMMGGSGMLGGKGGADIDGGMQGPGGFGAPGGAGGSGIGGFGQTMSPSTVQQELTWIYNTQARDAKGQKQAISYEFLISPEGKVSQIRVIGYVPKTKNDKSAKGLTLGSTYKDLIKLYGSPKSVIKSGDLLVCSYPDKHIEFQLMNMRSVNGYADPYKGIFKVVAIQINSVE